MIGRTVGHYRILERLGGGGMGVVYKAEDLTLGRSVALKFLPPELTRDQQAKDRFLREARAAALLDHPNICTVHEVGETADGQTFIAMGYYEGETLSARIERGAAPVAEAIDLVIQLARGLAKAHASGIVHRDIKPANAIVTKEGTAKILDFGLAKLAGATHLTQSNQTLGTLAYMAPEQFLGQTVGPPADLWALGVVLFELLAGQRPFRGEYSQAVAYSILNEQPLSLGELAPDAPAELDRIVKKLLRKDPVQRYQTAEEVLAELETPHGPGSGSGSGSGKAGPRVTRPREAPRAGARLGPYQIVEPLGSGGMGDVYRARDTRLGRQVAVKVLAPEFGEDAGRKQRFQREAKTISSLSHPNICTLFDVGEQEGIDYLVMEYLEGTALAERIAKGPLALGELAGIGAQIGEALGKAHAQGIVHRDLKPGNVMLTKSGVVKLVDFGLAKDVGPVTSTSRHAQTPDKPITAEGAIVGTLAYMAPEQLEGYEADARSDIFALGAILCEMATGRRAFEGETKASLIAAILTAEPAQLAALRAGGAENNRSLGAIEHVVRQCLEKKAERRWQSALDVASELRWIGDRGAVDSLPPPPIEGRRWSRLAGLATAVAIVAIAGVLWLGWSARTSTPGGVNRKRPVPRFVAVTRERGFEGLPSISPDGASFAYAALSADGDVGLDILVRRVGGENPVNLTQAFDGDDWQPAFSPDGNSIAFRSERDGGGIFVMGSTGESVRRISRFGAWPSWSPDGATIAFVSTAPGAGIVNAPDPALWIVNVTTGETRRVVDGRIGQPAFSRSGTRIAFSIRRDESSFLATVSTAGGEPTDLPLPEGISPGVWTRDGIWYAAPAGGPLGIWRAKVNEQTGDLLGEPELLLQSTGAWHPSPTPDGRRAVVQIGEQWTRILAWDFEARTGRVSPAPREIDYGKREMWGASPSPDGRWIASTLKDPARPGRNDVVLVRAETGEVLRLTTDGALRGHLPRSTWAPDSSKLYLVMWPEGEGELWSLRVDGSGRELLLGSSAAGEVQAALPAPDGRSAYVETGWRKGLGSHLESQPFLPNRRVSRRDLHETLGGSLVYNTSMKHGALRKITVEVPEDVLERARAEGEGVTEVVRNALELRANQRAWRRLERWSGKVTWSKSLEELRED